MLTVHKKLSQKPIPKTLFYAKKENSEYLLMDMTKDKAVGYLMVTPKKDELYINFLNVTKDDRGKGFGKTMLNFAKSLSEKLGFQGRLRVLSSLTPQEQVNPPHIFYRKNGFTTQNTNYLKEIDNAIKENRQVDDSLNHMIYMYYPEK